MPNVAEAMLGKHKAVLCKEVVDGLDLRNGETFVDATYGAGGHSKEVEKEVPGVKILTIDQDPSTEASIIGNFRDIDTLLCGVRPDAILLDLGFSSDQLESVPGLSFLRDEPLDMRLSRTGPTARDILNTFSERALELILRGFGEERYSKAIAKRIIEMREERPFQTTFDLVEAVGGPKGRIHPATRTFQSLRIAVNDELTALEEGLAKGFQILKPGGRLGVISFHSLEDRIVKNFFRNKANEGRVEILTKKPIVASEEELKENPRSRSAKLRICKKLN